MHVGIVIAVLLLVFLAVMTVLGLAMRSMQRWRERHEEMAQSITANTRYVTQEHAAPVTPMQTRAYWDAKRACRLAETALRGALCSALGIDPARPESWPLHELEFGDEEWSFTLSGVERSWVPSARALDRCWAMGFERCRIAYADGSAIERTPMDASDAVASGAAPR